jgi:hypothetical protein
MVGHNPPVPANRHDCLHDSTLEKNWESKEDPKEPHTHKKNHCSTSRVLLHLALRTWVSEPRYLILKTWVSGPRYTDTGFQHLDRRTHTTSEIIYMIVHHQFFWDKHWALPLRSNSLDHQLQNIIKCAFYGPPFWFIYMRVELWAKPHGTKLRCY